METLAVQHRPAGELAASAAAALAKSKIEAKFTIALHKPRSEMQARAKILKACESKTFSEGAKWGIMRWSSEEQKEVLTEGFTIRFAELALQAWGNVDISVSVAFEDEERIVVTIDLVDLENNLSYGDTVIMSKTVERRKTYKGAIVVGERETSQGEKVFILKCTEAEMLQKINAAKSKVIRTSGLRMIPQDILDEAWERVDTTKSKNGSDPVSDAKAICDAFQHLGVMPKDIEAWLQHSLGSVTKKEVNQLRGMYAAVKDGEASWADYMKKMEDDTIDMAPPKPAEKKPEPAKPAPVEVVKEAAQSTFPVSAASEGTPAEQLGKMIKDAGASVEDFICLAKEERQIQADAEIGSLDEVSVQVLNHWIAKPKAFPRAITTAKAIRAGGGR